MATMDQAKLLLGVLLAGTLLAGTALAADLTATTQAGQEVVVARHAVLSRSCAVSTPSIDVTQQPAHGKVEIRPNHYLVKTADNPSCVGREIDGTAVVYIPAAGFTGTDSFVFTTRYGNSARAKLISETATITVK
jgi:hypothetical protein